MSTFLLVLLLGPAWAQEAPDTSERAVASESDRARAVELFENGRTLFEEGNYQAAVAAWRRAYELTREPKLLFNIASAHERAGEYEQALEALNLYRALGQIEDPETLQRRMRNLEAQRDRAARDAAAAVAPASGPTAPPPSRSKASRVAGLGLVGVGATTLVAGGVMAGLAGAASGRARSNCLSDLCLDTAQRDLDSARQLGVGADIAMVSGAVLLGTGLVVLAPKKGARKSSLRVGVGHASWSTGF